MVEDKSNQRPNEANKKDQPERTPNMDERKGEGTIQSQPGREDTSEEE